MKKLMKKWLLPFLGLLTTITLFAGCNANDVLNTIDDVIDVNLKGTILVTRAFIRSFVKNKCGNIINISFKIRFFNNTFYS